MPTEDVSAANMRGALTGAGLLPASSEALSGSPVGSDDAILQHAGMERQSWQPPQLYHHIKWARSTALSSNKRSCSSSKGKPVTWALSGCTQARSMACSEQPRQMHTQRTSLGRPHPVTQPCRIMPTAPGHRPYSRHSRRSGCHPRLAQCRTQTSLDPQRQQLLEQGRHRRDI